ncbi:transport and Golgi organization protein 2 homolog [Panonychus citri]|uniref:transport and Golgi organization protein 2 homolog n=1 Tax=Panonychus citri TaxID=50023 RepID=UPI002307DFF7|nr:transport and Golgi organization protein 2 homolog [Panonychus citri]
MCLLFFQLIKPKSVNSFKLILISVRDEYMNRPATSASCWSDNQIIGAQDMEPGREGGTWLAINPITGKLGILLNILTVKSDINPNALGRGKIVTEFINCHDTGNYLKSLVDCSSNYNGFTLVAIDLKSDPSVAYVNNYNQPSVVNLNPGIHGFGNARNPLEPWRKVNYGLDKFRDIVTEIKSTDRKQELIDRLFHMVSDDTKLPDDERLRRQAYDWPDKYLKQLNSLFVEIPNKEYGSRTWSIILVDGQGNGDFIERTRVPPIQFSENQIKSDWKETRLSFQLSS